MAGTVASISASWSKHGVFAVVAGQDVEHRGEGVGAAGPVEDELGEGKGESIGLRGPAVDPGRPLETPHHAKIGKAIPHTRRQGVRDALLSTRDIEFGRFARERDRDDGRVDKIEPDDDSAVVSASGADRPQPAEPITTTAMVTTQIAISGGRELWMNGIDRVSHDAAREPGRRVFRLLLMKLKEDHARPAGRVQSQWAVVRSRRRFS